jgi:hypothetical protein
MHGLIPLFPVPLVARQLSPRTKFSQLEDIRLRSLVHSMPRVDWRVIGRLMGNRTPRQCRERYNNYLAPSLRIAPWTEAEESLLVEKFNQLGPKWSQMAVFFNRRSAVSLKNHYAKISQRLSGKPLPDGAEEDDEHDEVRPPRPDPAPNKKEEEKDGTVVSIIRAAEKVGESWFSSESDVKFSHVVHL